MTPVSDPSHLRRLVLGWLSCTADVVARGLATDDVADIEVVLPAGRLVYIDVCPEHRQPCAARDTRRDRLKALGVAFAPIRSLLDARFALEDLGALDPRAA